MSDQIKIHYKKHITYVNIDSGKRQKRAVNIYEDKLINLPPYALKFTHGSSLVTVEYPEHQFVIDDKICLNNIISKNVILHNVLQIKKNSYFARISHHDHGISMHGLYDPINAQDFVKVEYVDFLPNSYHQNDDIIDGSNFYIIKQNIDINIHISNVTTSNDLIGNIPVNYINGKHKVYLLFSNKGSRFEHDQHSYLIKLDRKCNINYKDGDYSNTISIRYYNLYGIPLNYLNTGAPLNDKFKYQYHIIVSTTAKTFTIDVNYPAIVDLQCNFYHYRDIDFEINCQEIINSHRGGGNQSYVRKVSLAIPGYFNPNHYSYSLDRNFKNVSKVEMISSIFPNSQRIINHHNNKLYWRDLFGGDHIHHLSVPPGNYSPQLLINTIQKEFKKISLHEYQSDSEYDDLGFYKYHIIEVDISSETDLVSFSSFGKVIKPSSILNIPDDMIEVTVSNKFPINDMLYLYLTPNSYPDCHYCHYHLYRFKECIYESESEATIIAQRAPLVSILINFYRTRMTSVGSESIKELRSINTNTILENFTYDHLRKEVTKINHGLNIGDLIITDQLQPEIGGVYIYEVTKIINQDRFSIIKYEYQQRYQFIYDDIIINWIDKNLDTYLLSVAPCHHNKTVIFNHENHQLNKNDIIEINSSIINGKYPINRILDDNHYEITLNQVSMIDSDCGSQISIKFPTKFQLLFNYKNTLGTILGFSDVGEDYAITPYQHTITNTDPYITGIPAEPNLKKLNMTGYNYFYICCPELVAFNNTGPVNNVFTIIKWTDNPGSVVFDSFVPNHKKFDPPLASLSRFNFSMYHPDGNLVEFNGLDHSFVLKITELYQEVNKNKYI